MIDRTRPNWPVKNRAGGSEPGFSLGMTHWGASCACPQVGWNGLGVSSTFLWFQFYPLLELLGSAGSLAEQQFY